MATFVVSQNSRKVECARKWLISTFVVIIGSMCVAWGLSEKTTLPQEHKARRKGFRSATELLWVFEEDKTRGGIAGQVRKDLSESQVSSPEKAEGVASGYEFRHGGISAQEDWQVVGLVRIAVSVPDFAEKGDLVWIVRFTTGEGITQELWISSTTSKVRPVLPSRRR